MLAAVFCVLAGMPEKRYIKAKNANENQCISAACKGEKEAGACDFFARVKPVKKTVTKSTRAGQETPVFKSEFKSGFLASMPDNVEYYRELILSPRSLCSLIAPARLFFLSDLCIYGQYFNEKSRKNAVFSRRFWVIFEYFFYIFPARV